MREINQSNLDRLPDDMKLAHRWMVYVVTEDGRKLPLSVDGKSRGASTDPSKWGTLTEAIQGVKNHREGSSLKCGLGFALGGGYSGLDLDHVWDGQDFTNEEARKVMDVVGNKGYAETSISGDGIHVIFKCDKPEGYVCKRSLGDGSEVEFYGAGRYFTISLDSDAWGNRDHLQAEPTVRAVLDTWLHKGPKKAPESRQKIIQQLNRAENIEGYINAIIANTNWGEGNRNHAIFKAAGNIRNKVGDESEVIRWVEFLNHRCVSPPLDRHEVLAAVESSRVNGSRPVENPFTPRPTVQPVIELDDEHETELDFQDTGMNTFVPKHNLKAFYNYLLAEEQGFLGCVIRDLHQRNNGGTPELDIATALVSLGTITAGQVKSSLEYTTPPTMMVVGLAPTGAGKEHGLSYVETLLERIGLDQRIGPDMVSSGEGIGSYLAEHPKCCFLLDEFGDKLGDSRGRISSFQESMKLNLKTSFTKGHKTWKPNAKADATKNLVIEEGLPSYYMASTPEAFWGAFRSSGVKCGLLGRMMIFRGEYRNQLTDQEAFIAAKLGKTDEELQRSGDIKIDDEVIQHAEMWIGDTETQKIMAHHFGKNMIFKYTDDAKRVYFGHQYDIMANAAKEDNDETKIWMRAMEKVSRVTLLLAISEKGPHSDCMIEKHHVEWAWKLVHAEVKLTYDSVINEISETDSARRRKDILDGLARKSCKTGLTVGMFTNRGVKWDNDYQSKQALDQLVQEGKVKCWETSRGNLKYIHRKYYKPEMEGK